MDSLFENRQKPIRGLEVRSSTKETPSVRSPLHRDCEGEITNILVAQLEPTYAYDKEKDNTYFYKLLLISKRSELFNIEEFFQ
ncbi:hypothetical protein V1477_011702 [Vespula maculifrons]|uniref:Uncharacterized protein n=1 Tax=Vespula maculifrons TaxID=7453 RepID=A0ABD2BZY3_VESMC